jgi:Ca2+-transporting ATPase
MQPPSPTAAPPRDRDAELAWHALDPAEAARRLGADLERGLDDVEVARRLARFGPNALAETRPRSPWMILIDQFRSLVVGLLVAATVVSLATGEILEAMAILVVIALNALIGFATEWKAARALTALKRQVVAEAHVIRSGAEHVVPAADLVPGDVVVLAAGGRVPADGRIVEARRLQVIEAALTGESAPVAKHVEPLHDPAAPLGDRRCMAYLGTTVADGRGRLLVTATGAATEVGKIGRLIGEAGEPRTPLEIQLARLGRTLIGIVLVLCAVIVAAGLLRGNPPLHMIEVGISLAIAAVPEGLPAVATITLALGMQRMARMRALVRRLPAVETLGATTVICTDKTGTLTQNRMSVQALVLGTRHVEVVSNGSLTYRDGSRVLVPSEDDALRRALLVGALCNDARLERKPDGMATLGDPTEGALLIAAERSGLDPDALARDYPRVAEIPFDSRRMRMATAHRAPGGGFLICVKGAPAGVLDACATRQMVEGVARLDDPAREAILDANRDLAARALRVLALAYRDMPCEPDPDDLERDLTCLGLVGLLDPLRPEAHQAVTVCRAAGIRVVMITGDQVLTASEIARQLGLIGADRDDTRVVHARDLDGLDDAGRHRLAAHASVFARVSPEHKLRIVEALQAQGQIVAMTGDGVNDAPALKRAEIGVAMGIMGTEVAKETADMIITDDNFATIVRAVEQGRVIYANIRRVIHFLFSCNIAEVLTVFAAILVGWPLPLLPLQILWLNLVTDVFPALALAVEPATPDVMRRPPRDPRAPLLGRALIGLVAWQGLVIAGVTLLAYRVGLSWYGAEGAGLEHAQTLAFMTLALAQVFHAFDVRSERRSILGPQLFHNAWLWAATAACLLAQTAVVALPPLRRVLHTHPPSPADFVLVTACALAPVAAVELVKLVRRERAAVAPRQPPEAPE